MSSALAIKITQDRRVTLVHLRGELDLHTAEDLADAVGTAIDLRPDQVVVELAHLEFIDSSGLSAIIQLHNQAEARDVELILRHPSNTASTLFEITAVDRVLNIRHR